MDDENPLQKVRLFFGAEVMAPWPHEFPGGRTIPEDSRHITLAFLGDVSLDEFTPKLRDFPVPAFSAGPVGRIHRCLFLPPRNPRVVAYEVEWLEWGEELKNFYGELKEWLLRCEQRVDQRDLLSHITVARKPFRQREWRHSFEPLPVMIGDLHLYQSVGKLTYRPVWSYPLIRPIEEIEHTADIAFIVRGKNLAQLLLHAEIALSFKFPPFVEAILPGADPQSLEEIVEELNRLIQLVDSEQGCPFKAVSFSGEISLQPSGMLEWEMIVDV
jgi:RNA 2',3'-cyclic 3'-phosphodiesterase